MSTTLAPPPIWAVPHPTPARQLAELRAEYPRAACWYGPKSERWLAAPAGAATLLQARTAAGLAHQLEQHYRQHPQTPRLAHPQRQTQRRGPGGDQAPRPIRTEQHRPAGGGSTTPAPGHGRHESGRPGGRFRRAMAGLGLVAAA